MEQRYTEEEITDEILALLREYFVGKIRKTQSGISVKFLNGQRFLVAVMEKPTAVTPVQ